jgi:hypothetical protein
MPKGRSSLDHLGNNFLHGWMESDLSYFPTLQDATHEKVQPMALCSPFNDAF